jgi:hypothetical protein
MIEGALDVCFVLFAIDSVRCGNGDDDETSGLSIDQSAWID